MAFLDCKYTITHLHRKSKDFLYYSLKIFTARLYIVYVCGYAIADSV
nr:MAG TPA: hypothetical protein [Caudoviricetes sp.]